MAGRIPQSFIDDLLDRIDIVEVVDHRVKLKKTGKNYSACCPFHDEKTPSFTVSAEKQFYYCFGCGASGNALGFIMEYERQGFPEAVEALARLAGLEVPREARNPEQDKREQNRRKLYQLLEDADQYYRSQLRQHPHKQVAINYLKGRGLSGQIARDFGIGFAPPGWDNLLQALGDTPDTKRLLTEGGMLIQREEDRKLYDRFRHRIMFPIHDSRGRVIGFGGRVLDDSKPKYLNSPETPVFHKGKELYGLYEACQAYRQLPRLLVVEGYMDVVALAQFGIRYGVATLGTACGEEHLQRAFRHTNEVVFCFDGDNAGRNAARRALENSLPVMQDGCQVKFLFLPEGEDPDTLVRQIGADKFSHMIELAVPLEDFLFDAVSEGIDVQSMEGRARLSKLAAPLLHKLPKGVYRELMFDNLASRTGLSKDTLLELIKELPTAAHPPEQTKAPTANTRQQPGNQQPAAKPPAQSVPTSPAGHPSPGTTASNPESHSQNYPADYGQDFQPPEPPPFDDYFPGEQSLGDHYRDSVTNKGRPTSSRYLMPPKRKLIALLLSQPGLAGLISDLEYWEQQPDTDLQLFAKLVKILQHRPHYKLHHLIGYWRAAHGEKETQYLADIAGIDLVQATRNLAQNHTPDTPSYDLESAFRDTLERLQTHHNEEKSAKSLEKLKNADFNQLSTEDKQRLVAEALAGKRASRD